LAAAHAPGERRHPRAHELSGMAIPSLKGLYDRARDGFRVRALDDEFVRWLSYANAGMLHPGNAWSMDRAVRGLRPGEAVVEIGSFAGLSTNAICHLLRKHGRDNAFYTCDNWDVTAHGETRRIEGSGVTFPEYARYVKESFVRNVSFFSPGNRPHTIEASSADFLREWREGKAVTDVFERPVRLGGRIGFAYVDGIHSVEAVSAEFEALDASMEAGGFILFDDSADSSPFGLNRLMREIAAAGRYELVGQTPNYFFCKRG
jgi:hypothetical protein